MDNPFIIIAVVFAILFVDGLMLMLFLGRRNQTPRPTPASLSASAKADRILTLLGIETRRDPLLMDVYNALDAGRKIEGIRIYRQLTGAGLKEAKDAVEGLGDLDHKLDLILRHLESGGEIPDAPIVDESVDELGFRLRADSQAAGMTEVREWLARGRKIEAIKVYRNLTGAGLKEAKDAVEAMERGQL